MNKKLFISVPMRGRTEENIRKSIEKMHKLAEIVFDQELEVIPSYIEDRPPVDCKEAVWYLGESIKKMADADYVIGIDGYSRYYRGVYLERQIAGEYDIPYYNAPIEVVAPDAIKIAREEEAKTCHSVNVECGC